MNRKTFCYCIENGISAVVYGYNGEELKARKIAEEKLKAKGFDIKNLFLGYTLPFWTV